MRAEFWNYHSRQYFKYQLIVLEISLLQIKSSIQ